ncbi:hypothetical protein EAW55_02365 [Legionella jordanis]|nr:hypothetical protein EAW55_02365 [Legionella jordanis]RMX19202.1 hypothetical protein EAS68_07130 [Legionella jordanis]
MILTENYSIKTGNYINIYTGLNRTLPVSQPKIKKLKINFALLFKLLENNEPFLRLFRKIQGGLANASHPAQKIK